MWEHLITERTTGARLRAAFLAASAQAWPDLVWLVGERPDALLYPVKSDSYGSIEIWFDDDEITTFYRDTHFHRGVYNPYPEAQLAVEEAEVAAYVVKFVERLLAKARS